MYPVIRDEVVELESFQVVGVAAVTSNRQEAGPEARIPGLWQQFMQGNGQRLQAPYLYGVYSNYESDENGSYQLLIGSSSESEDGKTSDRHNLVSVQIPASKYRVFVSRKGPMPQVVIETWSAVWDFYRNSEEQRAFTADFERYSCEGMAAGEAESQVEIYIAIK